ncbi:glutamate receptor ionotropic, kainate glr-3-like [Macrobrachium rosenbergii]|uniref:glutamate receptor ionotropic, kainate glr-3-like n=1 Tax=Macrobrachium rosenbergii TaxID=79674 RepID=UPI0034D7277F
MIFNCPYVHIQGNLISLQLGKELTVRDPLTDLLQASLAPTCTTVFITDGGKISTNIFQALSFLEVKPTAAFVDTQHFKESNTSGLELMSIVQQTLKIKQTSSCVTILLVTENIDVVTNLIRISFDNGLLADPGRLLLLTQKAFHSLHLVREQLSVINAAVVSLKELSTYQRLTEGGHLTIAAIDYAPHATLRFTAAKNGSSKATVFGPIMDVVKMLSAAINFTYEIVPFISYGYLLPNGSWNGLVGAVLKKEADMALGPLAITYERSRVIEYTVPIFVDYLRIQAKRGDTEVDPWSFVMPFNKEVWASLFGSLALVITASWFIKEIIFDYALSKSSAFNYCSVLLQQGVNDTKLAWWERMILGGWLLIVLISGESYSGNLMSQLAVRYISQPYQSLRDVLDDPNIKIMWMANTVYEQYLKGMFVILLCGYAISSVVFFLEAVSMKLIHFVENIKESPSSYG